MKKFNLIERLLSYSHEKQSPQRFARYAAMLIMLLTLGVGQMWANPSITKSGTTYIYLDRTNMSDWSTSGYTYFVWMYDNSAYRAQTSNIANTKLAEWYGGSGWDNITHVGYMYGNWGASNSDTWSNITSWASDYTGQYGGSGNNFGFSDGNFSVITATGSSKSWTITPTYIGNTGYSDMNKTVTIRAKVSTNGGSTYSEANTPGALTAESYKFSAHNTCGTQDATTEASLSAGSSSATFTAGYTANTSVEAASVTGYDFMGWYEGSTKVLDGRTGTMNPHGAVTLYAYYKVKQYAVSYGVNSSTRNGTIQLNSESAVSTTDSKNVNHGTSITFTAVPSTGYQVEGWYSDAACTAVNRLQSKGNTYNAGTLTAAKTVYVKFETRTGGTVTLSAGTGGQVSLDGSSWGASKAKSEIKTATAFNIYAQANTGYEFSSWAKSSGSGTISSTSSASTSFTPVAYEDATVSASFSEVTVTVSPTCAYDKGDPEYSNPTASNSGTVGIVSTSELVAPDAGEGYVFAGWTLSSNLVVTVGDKTTDQTITVRTNGDGEDVTATANYNEVRDSRWHLVGGSIEVDEVEYTIFPDAWNINSTTMMKKKSGECDDKVVYMSITVEKTGTYMFKVVDDNGASSDIWYGYSTGETYLEWTATDTKYVYSGDGNGNELKFTPDFAGTYEFKVDYSGTYPAVTITYPEVYAVIGSFNSWNAATNPLEFDGNAGSADITIAGSGTNYEFKIVDHNRWSGFATSGKTITATESNIAISVGSGNNIALTADIYPNGSYRFAYNKSTNKLGVTYPTAYTVNYSAVLLTGSGTACSAPSASPSFPTGKKVLNGTSVTFTAATENSGYTFQGWYSTATPTIGTTTPLSSDNDADKDKYTYTATISAATTIYAIYTENNYTVTVQSSDATYGGTVASSSVTGHVATKVTLPTAAVKPGYYFVNWTVEDGTATIDNATSATAAEVYNMTDACTVQANFNPIWTIAGGDGDNSNPDALGNWNTNTNTLWHTYVDATVNYAYFDITTLLPNTDYYFKVVQRSAGDYAWWRAENDADEEVNYGNSNARLNIVSSEGDNFHLRTAAAGTYTFDINLDGSKHPIKVHYPTSWLITSGVKTVYNPGASETSDATETGGTFTAVDNSSNDVKGANKYVAASATVTFTAEAKTGYEFDGWYSDSSCDTKYVDNDDDVNISGEGGTVLELSTITENKTAYAKFKEVMTTVQLVAKYSEYGVGTIKHGDDPAPSSVKVGVHTTYEVTAVPNSTHYFEFWELDPWDGVKDFTVTGTGEDYATTTITGKGGGLSGQKLTANFKELDEIYFLNQFVNGSDTTRWDSVYVGFGPYWTSGGGDPSGDAGAGVKPEYTSEWHGDTVHMEKFPLGGKDVYKAVIPRSFTREHLAGTEAAKHIAFYNKGKQGTYTNFHDEGTKVVYRDDYSRYLDMFIPAHTSEVINTATYYRSGYWMQHYTSQYHAYYYLKRRKSSNTYWQMGEFTAARSGYNEPIQFTLRVDNTSGDSCYYRITSAGGENYVAASTITNDNCTDIELVANNGSDSKFTLTPTVEGDYIITITQVGEKMKVSVNYPIAKGDYRLKHTYTIRNKKDNADSTVYAYSDVIKAANAAGDTASMYLNMTTGTELVLQKCKSIAAGKPVWSAGNAVSAFNTTTFNKGNGVYKFAVAINTVDSTVSSVTAADLYTGNFYIKTDGANGEWARYKIDPDNIMHKNEINFNRTDPKKFDYYFCHYYSAGRAEKDAGTFTKATNIKCVIANEYNNAVSDTLVGDDILGTYTEKGQTKPHETLPYAGSVRFSYNSVTNEVKRTYLNGSTWGGESFLYLVAGKDDYIYTSTTESSETDVHDIAEGNCKFSDDQNWTYEVLVYAYPLATAGVKTTYDSKVQTLIATDHPLIGGADKGGQKYPMKLVYDFKTNYIMSAFTPAGDISTNIEDVDVLLVRHEQDPGTTITFAKDGLGEPTGTLKSQKIIGAIRFNRAEMQYNVSNYSLNRNLLKYFISFPFDVRVRDIFGINSNYGDAYVISRYAGDKRAEKGFFRGDGTTTFWEELTIDSVMHANKGYVVILDNDYFNGDLGNLWEYDPIDIYMYFPSTATIGAITPDETITIDVPQHECKINRKFTDSYTKKEVNHKYTDTDWNLMGVPVFTTVTGDKDGSTYDPGKLFVMTELDTTKAIQYFYEWYTYDNEFHIRAAHGFEFLPMHSYMVQYHGSVTFTGTAPTPPASVAARRTPEVKKNYQIELQALDMNEQLINRTYVELRENACDTFELNEDVYMSPNSSAINIYTFAGDYDVAANVLSVGNHIVPVGYNVLKAGTFTFTMPSNFDGEVTLIDTYTGTSTNLALGDYTVNLPKGADNDRFELEININNAPTAIDGVNGGSLKDGKAHKFIMNDMLYILRDGKVFDAQGRQVK